METRQQAVSVGLEEFEKWFWSWSIHVVRTTFAVVVGLVFF